MVSVTVTASNNRAMGTKLIARHMSHAIGDDQERTEHIITNLLLTRLHKICVSEAKLNDMHLIGRPSAEKYEWQIHWRKHVTTTLQFTVACYAHTSPMHYIWQEAQLSSCQISTMTDVPPIVCESLEYRRLGPLVRSSNTVDRVLYMIGRQRYTLPVAANRWQTPRSSVYGKTRSSLLGIFGVVSVSLLLTWFSKWRWISCSNSYGIEALESKP
jgi:hypothetical protein